MTLECSPEAAKVIAELFAMARRARNKTQSRTVTTLMLKGGRPAHWLQENLLRDLERIGLVQVDARGACKLTPVGVEAAGWLEAEARRVFPLSATSLLEASMARLMNDPEGATMPASSDRPIAFRSNDFTPDP